MRPRVLATSPGDLNTSIAWDDSIVITAAARSGGMTLRGPVLARCGWRNVSRSRVDQIHVEPDSGTARV